MLVLIHLNTALNLDPHAFFDHIKHDLLLRFTPPFLDDKRAAVVRHLDFQHVTFLTSRAILKDLMLRRKNVGTIMAPEPGPTAPRCRPAPIRRAPARCSRATNGGAAHRGRS